MEKLRMFAVSSLMKPPTQMSRKKDKEVFTCTLTLPLPPQLLIFNHGEWPKGDTKDVTLDVFLDSEKIGEMNEDTKCFTWEADSLAGRPDGEKILIEVKVNGMEIQKERSPAIKGKKVGVTKKKPGRASSQTRKDPTEDNNKVLTDISDKINTNLKEMTVDSDDHKNQEMSEDVETVDDGDRQEIPQNPVRVRQGRKKSSPLASSADKKKSSPLALSADKKKTSVGPSEVKKTRQTQLNFASTKTPSPAVAEPVEQPKATKASKRKSCPDTKPNVALTVTVDGLESDTSDSTKGKLQSGTELMDVDEDGRCEAQALNESTPQLADMPSPLPRKPAKQNRQRSGADKTPEGPAPKKRGTRMRALTSDAATPKTVRTKTALGDTSFAENIVAPEENAKSSVLSEGRMTRCVDLSARSPRPSARWGHTMLLTQPRCAVLIGGQGDRQQLSRDSVWTLHTETRKWRNQEIQSEGQKPENRMGHSATYDPIMRCVYIFGGSKNSRWFHDVHVYDVDENKWTLAKVNGKAPTRAYHTSTLHRHELWIFGGVYPRPDPNPDGCSNDVHIFSPVMQNWYSPIVQGDKPLPRSGHSATLIRDQMVMFGGWDAPFCYNDLFILDMTTVDWSKPVVKGTPPKPRSWHASCALSNSRILIHGGYDGNNALEDSFIFDLGGLSWSQLVIPNAPKARAGHAAVCVPYNHENQEEDEILVFGGGDNDGEFFSDLLSFSIPFNPVVEVE